MGPLSPPVTLPADSARVQRCLGSKGARLRGDIPHKGSEWVVTTWDDKRRKEKGLCWEPASRAPWATAVTLRPTPPISSPARSWAVSLMVLARL